MSKLGPRVAAIFRPAAERGPARPRGHPAPRTPSDVDVVARRGIEDLVRQVERLEVRLNLILAVILGTLIVDAVKAFVH